jgi:flagellar biosynthesis protein FlhB
VYPHLVAWEGVEKDTKRSYSASLREISQNASNNNNNENQTRSLSFSWLLLLVEVVLVVLVLLLLLQVVVFGTLMTQLNCSQTMNP